MVHASEFRVRYSETDQMGVVYHANYLAWCEIGRTELMRSVGRSYGELEKTGIALAVVDVSLRYMRPAKYDEILRVKTRIGDVRSRVVRFDYDIENVETGAALATGSTTLVAMNRDARGCGIPAELRVALERFRDA